MAVLWSSAHGVGLRRARNSRGWSQAEVAGRVGCTSSRISELERNRESGGRPASPSSRLYAKLVGLFPELAEGSPVQPDIVVAEQRAPETQTTGAEPTATKPRAQDRLDNQQVELVGRAALEAALVRHGFEVARPNRDKGIDLIVYEARPGGLFQALPIQMKAKTSEGFDIKTKYDRIPGLVLAYVWGVGDTSQRFFLMTYSEAVALLGHRATTSSWREKGGYNTSTPSRELSAAIRKYEDRWDWLRQQLSLAELKRAS